MIRSNLLATAAAATLAAAPAVAQTSGQSTGQSASTVETVTVTAKRLGEARTSIQTQIGASTYTITASDIQDAPGGDNTLLNQ